MNVWMLVYNNCTTDQRVLKEAATLSDAGHDVTVVAVLDKTTTASERRGAVTILRIDRRPLHYRLLWAVRQIRRLIRLPASKMIERLGLRPRLEALSTGARPAAGRSDSDATWGPRVDSGLVFLLRVVSAPYRVVSRLAHRTVMLAHKPLMYWDWYWRAYRLTRPESIDVVHAHDLNTLPVAAAIARRGRAKLVYDAHELYPDVSTLSRRESTVWRRLERPLIRRADRVLTVCDSIGEELVRRYGIASPQVVLNCPPASGDAADRLALRQMAGIDGMTEPVVLYQGGFVPHRGLEPLVQAAALLERGVLVLMGWGRLEADLAALVRREELSDRVKILPPVSQAELPRYTSGADVGVIPYEPVGLNNYFTTPNKLFEYIAAGLPVIASDLPELRKVLHGHRVGVTFERAEASEIAHALNSVLCEPALLAEMRANALAVRNEYTWERQALKLLEVYDDPGAGGSTPAVADLAGAER